MAKNKVEYEEYRGKNFTISFDSEKEVVFLKDWGGVDEQKAKEMKDKIIEFLEKISPGSPVRLLIEVEKYIKVTPEARRVFFSLVKIIREKKVRMALITSSPTVRVVARFIGVAIESFNAFDTKEEGMKWLEKQKK